jgi:hypothetical protein
MTSHTDGLIPTRGKTFQTGENTKKTVSEITKEEIRGDLLAGRKPVFYWGVRE